MKIYKRKILLARRALRKFLSNERVRQVKSLLDAVIACDAIECKASEKKMRKISKLIISI
ncbi:MAG: hypothetical protein WCJ58_01145 [bacterium]